MIEIGSRAKLLPAPPAVVWRSLVRPDEPGTRPWLRLDDTEVAPRVLAADEPARVVWSSLWPARPDDEIHLDVTASGAETLLSFTLLTPGELPGADETDHLRRRVSVLLFADLRYSYGQ